MISIRTKVLIWSAVFVTVLGLALPILPLLYVYLAARRADSTVFITGHFHLVPIIVLLVVAAGLLASALISFRYDKSHGTPSKRNV